MKRLNYQLLKFLLLFTLIFTTYSVNLFSAYLTNVPVKITQPDGREYNVFASGDEFYNWVHDANGYTIIQDDKSGFYVYAKKEGEILLPTKFVYGKSDPGMLSIPKYLKFSDRIIQERMDNFIRTRELKPPSTDNKKTNSLQLNTGTINNLVVFIRFSDESEFTDNISTYSDMFNATTGNSMYNYFKEVSYNSLEIQSTFYPMPEGASVLSYQDSHPRGYFRPYSATNTIGYTGGDGGTMRRDREHTLLVNAVNAIQGQVPTNLDLDNNSDGNVDNVCFIVSGSPDGWASLLWPHMWSLYSQSAYINGKRVYTFNFQIRSMTLSSGVGVLCHEMFHSLGSPDLYHYTSNGIAPVYRWDLMENNQDPPQHMLTYMKFRYGGWISSIPEITTSGVYTLNPVTSPNQNCYKIKSPNSTYEHFMVEYRRKTGTFENSLPGSGLIVYRINSSVDGQGNRSGPPDEVYVYRPNGTTSANGTPANANFSSDVGRVQINNGTNPASFLTNGSAGYLDISEVSTAGATISFRVTIGTPLIPTLLSPIDNATNLGLKPTFSWNAFTGAISYNLQVATTSDFTTKVIDRTGITGTSFTALSDLNYNSSYYWRVNATTGSGTTGWSSTFKFTTVTSIRIDSIIGTLCAGSPFTVYYTTGAAFGAFNSFKVQVSDTLGVFSARPLELQYVNSQTSGSIACTMPDTMPGGTKYRMRIVADDPPTIGLDNGNDLTITPLLLPFVNGPLNVCEFSRVTYQTSSIIGIRDKWEILSGGKLVTKPDSSIIVVDWGSAGKGSIKLSKKSIAGCFDSIIVNVNINPIPTPEISGNLKVCMNNVEVYTADLDADTKNTWTISGGKILSILNDRMVKVQWIDTAKGTITLTQTILSTKCSSQLSKNISITPMVSHDPISGNTSVCVNELENYISKSKTGVTNLWMVSGGSIIGSKNKDTVSIRWSAGKVGTITLVYSMLSTGCSDTLRKNININPKPEPMPIGLASGCENSLGRFYVIHDDAIINTWSVSGGILTTNENSDTCNVLWGGNGPGKVLLKQTNKNTSCFDSVVIDLDIISKPPKPTITKNNDVLESDNDFGNQWYLNDKIINGATSKTYKPIEDGNYSVIVTLKNCSSLPSDKYNFVSSSVGDFEISNDLFRFGPNPNNGRFTITFIREFDGSLKMKISDVKGVQVFGAEIYSSDSPAKEIDVDFLPSGIYFITIFEKEKSFKEKIIINN